MRFMLLVKGTQDSEAGIMPTTSQLARMGEFNEEMLKAGILLAADGLRPSSKGTKVTFTEKKVTVTDGPFAEAKELISGFWIIDVKTHQDAVAWASRVPFFTGEIEVRQVSGAEDFGEAFTPELQEQEAALAAQLSQSRD